LPEPVQLEVEELWLRELAEKGQKILRARRDLDRYAAKVLLGAPSSEPSSVSPEEARAKYKRELDIRRRFNIEVSGYTTKSAGAFFASAARREPPFSGDAMFRGAVILNSVLEHAKTKGCSTCILITADVALRKPEVTAMAALEVPLFRTYGSIDEFTDDLTNRLKNVQKKALSDDRDRAREALEADRGKIEEFGNALLEISDNDLAGISGIVKRVTRLEIGEFRNIRTPYPPPSQVEVAPISADVSVKVHATVERYPTQPPRTFRVGEPESSSEAVSFHVWPVLTDVTYEVEAGLEATARRAKNGGYSEIVPQNMRLKPSISLLSVLAQSGGQGPAGDPPEEPR
jgi:hypothetical protein